MTSLEIPVLLDFTDIACFVGDEAQRYAALLRAIEGEAVYAFVEKICCRSSILFWYFRSAGICNNFQWEFQSVNRKQ
ncbi:hypothetical protein ACFOWX_01655 [Sphingorhabdus arenilitoris]|uniref:Uncharacterized protein n=1 Tax=Sphingorhabdus arenilitoris TaxID=1490041 RepID=A0ABV8RD34_9SPHN